MISHEILKIKKSDKSFPKRLREIPDCPKEIFTIGNIGLLKEKNILAVVGSRRPSEYGVKTTHAISSQLAEVGVVIVSGLAIGIDAKAHLGALDAKGKTVAVLGSAIDNFQPTSNALLARRIIESGGLVLSEYPSGAATYPGNFPLRNRIIAGISDATLVVEAAEKSGSLITAFLATEYNRDVFAVPGNIDRVLSKGTNSLIKRGAQLVSSNRDLERFFALESGDAKKREVRLTLEEAKIINILVSAQADFDQLIKLSRFDTQTLNGVLLTLEMKRLIKNFNGQYSLAGN